MTAFADMQEGALAIRSRYAAVERQKYGREWGVPADRYGVDLEHAFAATMDELEERLA